MATAKASALRKSPMMNDFVLVLPLDEARVFPRARPADDARAIPGLMAAAPTRHPRIRMYMQMQMVYDRDGYRLSGD